jgi:hypothetical protein
MTQADINSDVAAHPWKRLFYWLLLYLDGAFFVLRLEWRRQRGMIDIWKGTPDWFVEGWAHPGHSHTATHSEIEQSANVELSLRIRRRMLKT